MTAIGVRKGIASGLMGALLLSLIGCTPPPPPAEEGDPRPSFDGAQTHAVDAAGGVVADGRVTVTVPTGSVAGSPIQVTVGETVGTIESGFADAELGEPVRVEHDADLSAPLSVSWTIDDMTADQAASVFLVRWDEEREVWRTSDESVTVEGNTLTATVQEFSTINWLFGGEGSQVIGEFFGTRTAAPTCTSDPLPDWVRTTVDPDEDQPNAAILVCFEPDTRDEIVTVRVANNRTFSQLMTLTAGEKYEWMWRGDQAIDIKDTAYSALGSVVDTEKAMLVPPGKEVAVGVSRPAAGADSYYSAEATVDGRTMFADLLAFGMNKVSIGGLDNPALNAFLQLLYECAGARMALEGSVDVTALTGTVAGCADELGRADSELGIRFEQLSRKMIAEGGLSQAAAIKANRAVHTLARWAKILTAGEVAMYLSDQFANALVGPLSWGVYGAETPQPLGAWTATCSSVVQDSTRLYQNIALQDAFADTSKELSEFPTWQEAGRTAIQPLLGCSAEYQTRFADEFPDTWADPTAAEVLADLLRDIASRWLISGEGIGPLKLGSDVNTTEELAAVVGEEHLLCVPQPPSEPASFGIVAYGAERVEGIVVLGLIPDGAPVTGSGISLGSSVADLSSLDTESRQWEYESSYSIHTWSEDGATMSAFAGPDGLISGLGVGDVTYYLGYC